MSVASPLPAECTPSIATGSGPPVVLVHGFVSSAEADWPSARWAAPLAGAGRESMAVRLPGHPGAPAVTSADEVSSARLLARLAETVRSTAAEAVDVVGYSLGARLAWDLVAASPIPVRRLVLGGLSPSEPFAAVDVAAARASIAGGPPAADPVTGMIAAMVSAPGQDAASLLNVVEGLAQEPFDPAAKPPTVPTLFLAGQDDPMSQGIEQIAGLVPDARVQRVPGDHLGALASEEFRAAALDFLGLDQDRI